MKSRGVAAIGCLLLLCANVSEASQPKPGDPVWNGPTSGYKILVMRPDVEVSLLTAGGLLEPNQEWTDQARSHLRTGIVDVAALRQVSIVEIESASAISADTIAAAENLHEAVARSVLMHRRGAPMALPTKKTNFDWTLGETVAPLRDVSQADYAFFLYARDSFSSAGRVIMQLFSAAAGIGVSGGQQIGLASLVDLKTGAIVWQDLNASQFGDLRKPEGARDLIEDLFESLPGQKPKKK
jgi:hypothetical protein